MQCFVLKAAKEEEGRRGTSSVDGHQNSACPASRLYLILRISSGLCSIWII
jgi:hypothetical protein